MKSFFSFIILGSIFFFSIAYAQDVTPPVVNRNVHILKNVNPSQCPASWNGTVDPEIMQSLSGYGSGVLEGVQSCTGCAIDSSSNDCVCSKCYSYFN